MKAKLEVVRIITIVFLLIVNQSLRTVKFISTAMALAPKQRIFLQYYSIIFLYFLFIIFINILKTYTKKTEQSLGSLKVPSILTWAQKSLALVAICSTSSFWIYYFETFFKKKTNTLRFSLLEKLWFFLLF